MLSNYFKLTLFHFFLLWMAAPLYATDLRLLGVEVENPSDTTQGLSVRFTLAWDHAWHNERNHDAAWVFLKFKPFDLQYNARHARLRPAGHLVLGKSPTNLAEPVIEVSDDHVGVFVYPSARHRGPVQWTLRLYFDLRSIGQFDLWQGQWSLHALEMVYVPAGGFTLGDPDTTALRAASFFKSGPERTYAGLYAVKAENQALAIGPVPGQLYYRARETGYQGDGQGPLPAAFPKGVGAFYIQKYELSQGEYAVFLNALSEQSSAFRANFGSKSYYRSRGTISFDGQLYIAQSPRRPLNFVSWDDGCAYADWAGDFNPHSPVGWRNFAAWSGGPRTIAYGFRCVRTAR